MTERGLIISNPMQFDRKPGEIHIGNNELDPQELRFALLFWDKFDRPITKQFVMDCPTSRFLEDCGLLTRTRVDLPRGPIPAVVRELYRSTYLIREHNEPGCWSVATGERSVIFHGSDLADGRGAVLRLHHALPVPDKDVPIEDILEFRVKRRAELLALRHYLERIYQTIVASADGALALHTEIELLKSSIDDYMKSTRGLRWLFRLVDFEGSLNLADGLKAGAITYAATTSLTSSACVAAGTAALTVKAGPSLAGAKTRTTPFSYISRYHKEVFPLS